MLQNYHEGIFAIFQKPLWVPLRDHRRGPGPMHKSKWRAMQQ